MSKVMKKVICMLLLTLCGCSSGEVDKDVIRLDIQLNTDEDIGLLIADYEADGQQYSSGTSNADGSMLKHGETEIIELYKDSFENTDNMGNISLTFTIITEYVKPNYENEYPSEYTVPVEGTIQLEPVFGKTYLIEITGNSTDGYESVLMS